MGWQVPVADKQHSPGRTKHKCVQRMHRGMHLTGYETMAGSSIFTSRRPIPSYVQVINLRAHTKKGPVRCSPIPFKAGFLHDNDDSNVSHDKIRTIKIALKYIVRWYAYLILDVRDDLFIIHNR